MKAKLLTGTFARIPLILLLLSASPKAISQEAKYPKKVLEAGNRAVKLIEQGQYLDSIPHWQQLLSWQSKNLGENNVKTILTQKNLNAALIASGQVEAAIKGYQHLLEITSEAYGAQSIDVIRIEIELVKALRSARKFDEAEALANQSLGKVAQLKENDVNDEHADLIELLGTIFHETGFYTKALNYQKKALDIRQADSQINPIKIATSLGNQAQAMLRLGHYAEAKELQHQALDIYQKQDPKNSKEQQATIMTNIALTEKYLGKTNSSKLIMEQAIKLKASHIGRDHPETARLLINLGIYEEESGDIQKAMSLYKEAFEILMAPNRSDELSAAFALQRMAQLARSVHRSDKAKEWASTVLQLRQQKLDPNHPDIATTMFTLGMAELQLGNTQSGQSWITQAIKIRKKRLGDSHPYTSASELILGLSYKEEQQLDQSLYNLREAIKHYTSFFKSQAPLLAANEQIPFLNSLSAAKNLFYSVAFDGKHGADVALNARLNLHGMIEELERRRNQVAQGSTNSIEDKDQYSAGDQNIAKRISKVLKHDEVLVEFIQYKPTHFRKGVFSSDSVDHYIALTLFRDGTINAHDLGPAKIINEKIWLALLKTQRAEYDAEKAWIAVSDSIIGPLAKDLSRANTLYVSPDGELHRVPFSALAREKDTPESTKTNETKRIRILTTGRDLLRPNKQIGLNQKSKLILANPNYFSTSQELIIQGQQQIGNKLPSQWKDLQWQRLPGTQVEGEAINKLIGGSLFTDTQANASRLQWENPPSLIHIATHGAFLPKEKRDARSQRTELNLIGNVLTWDDPMKRSVFVLSGANSKNEDIQSSAYINAKEVSLMDMAGTKLVVISACESGIGQIQLGDGIYGMRRGITIAGAQSSLLSLWKVDDKSTAAFMEKFYLELAKGSSPETALEKTQNFLKAHQDSSLRSPYVWAAFQLYGISWL